MLETFYLGLHQTITHFATRFKNNLQDPNQSGFKAAHSTARSAKLIRSTTRLSCPPSGVLGFADQLGNGSLPFLPGRRLISDSDRISACLAEISSWMAAHQLKLNPSKTELLFIQGDSSPGHDLAISLHNDPISPSATARNLGAAHVLVQSLVIAGLDYCNALLAGLPMNATRTL
ncbi:uncharacterized protein LOC132862815 isoform X2 [Tachysurus vachellii]|uniref:uncharacterized protein LOC132862815 isoform X2 n=1 Tax=Tachysurus vachellii TaxID=175792 RepID=UPI00296B2337|nr:uncharacterized protein LOC132862815 isoform X2 [Tachysurus vachellii]